MDVSNRRRISEGWRCAYNARSQDLEQYVNVNPKELVILILTKHIFSHSCHESQKAPGILISYYCSVAGFFDWLVVQRPMPRDCRLSAGQGKRVLKRKY